MVMKKYAIVFTTFPDRKTAEKICRKLVEQKLVACSQIINGITSIYHWNKKIEKSKECLCLLKTEKRLFNEVKNAIVSMHPYKIPEIIAVDISHIEEKYRQWIEDTIS